MRILAVAVMILAVSGGYGWSQNQDYALEEMIYLSCKEAWAKSGESIDNTIEMIRVMTEFSLTQRELEVENGNDELASRYGNLIKAMCTADPDDLLFNAVDKSIRRLTE